MARILANGTMVFPQRGNPPKCPDGYDPDPNDPWVFHPVYEDCSQRTTVPSVMPCGKITHRPWCKLHDCEASPATCADCPDVDFISVPSEILDAQQPTIVSGETPSAGETSPKVHDLGVKQTVDIGHGG